MIAIRSLAVPVSVFVIAAVGCSHDATFTEPIPPNAAIHWVEAVPDTMQEDMHTIDMASNAGLYDADFRGSTMFYQGIRAGSRHIRIFNSSQDVTIAQQVMVDTTIDFAATDSLTFIHMGFARPGSTPARQVKLFTDKAPDPGAGNVGIRVINAGAGLANVDAFLIRHPQDTAALGTPFATNVAYGATSGYTAAPADTGTQTLQLVVTATGTTAPVLARVSFPVGQAADTVNRVNPIAGARIAGSTMTAVFVPRSVAGSMAPQAFTTPSAVILVDRRPPDKY